MLVKFAFSNVFSFKDKQEISFEPEPLKELNEQLSQQKGYGDSEKFLKALAIYGHNSHGKSNFLKAFHFFIKFIKWSFKEQELIKELQPFLLNESTINKPSYFQIIFIVEDIKYRYGFEVNNHKIFSEWLYYAPFATKESALFVRVEQEFRISKLWNKESGYKIESQAIPFAVSNVLLLSVLTALQNEKIVKISDALSSIIVIQDLTNTDYLTKAALIFSNERYSSIIQNFLDDSDLGFNTIFDKIEKKLATSNRYDEGFLKSIFYEKSIAKFELFTYHKIFDEKYNEKRIIEFDFLKHESDGTIKFFVIVCLLAFAIKNNALLIIDELDSKFHSDLLNLIITKFHSPLFNSSEAQLIFTSHNTVLLDKKLRRDQIFFIEKNDYGESLIKPMHTKTNPIRIDASVEKDYRKGKLGGVSKKLRNNDPNQTSLF